MTVDLQPAQLDNLSKLKSVQEQLQNPNLSMFEKMDLKDEELALKRELGLIVPPKEGESCDNCSA